MSLNPITMDSLAIGAAQMLLKLRDPSMFDDIEKKMDVQFIFSSMVI